MTEAMDELKMTSIERKRNGAILEIDATTQDDRPVLVTLRPHDRQTHQLPNRLVRRRAAREGFLERTGVRLGTLPPAAIPENPPSAPASPLSPRAVPAGPGDAPQLGRSPLPRSLRPRVRPATIPSLSLAIAVRGDPASLTNQAADREAKS